jgi:hypothetical protein
MTVAVDSGVLSLDGRQVPLISAEVQFWRLDPDAWDPILRQVAATNIPIVATYLSWRRHQPTPGALDLQGHSDPRLDVRRFMGLCAEHGLLVHLKPGPWICAEEVGGGYPDWLLAEPDVWELDAHRRPLRGYEGPFVHPVPAYLHPRYLAAASTWLQSVAGHLADLVWPAGPIIMAQLDNEPSHCFRDGPREAGHHRVTQAAYRQRGAGDWAAFASWLLAEHLRRLRQSLDGTGFANVLWTVNTNEHRVPTVPADPAELARAVDGIGGEDLYYRPPLRRADIERVALSGALATAGEELAWAPEIQAGIWRLPGIEAAHPDPTPGEQRLWYLSGLASGLRGLNFYMFADREHWAFAPVSRDGRPTPFLAAVEAAVRVVRAFPEWGGLRPVPSVALAWRRSDLADAWEHGGPYVQRIRAAFRRLLRAGHTVAIWDVERRPQPEGLALVDPRLGPTDQIGVEPTVSASSGAVAVLQRGGGAEALFVLNPQRRGARIRVQFRDGRRRAWLLPVVDHGPPVRLDAGAATLRLDPLGTAVFRVEPDGA